MRLTSALLALLFIPGPLSGQVQVKEGQRVALRIPEAAFALYAVPQNPGLAQRRQETNLIAYVERGDTALLVNGQVGWIALGWPAPATFKIGNVWVEKQKRILHLRFERKKHDDAYLVIPIEDSAFVLDRILAPPSDSALVHHQADTAIARIVFAGQLAEISPAAQFRILAVADSVLRGDTLQIVRFQGRPYIMLRASPSGYVYNTSQTSEPERQAGTLNEVSFPLIRALGSTDSTLSPAFGFAVVTSVKSKQFGGDYSFLNSTARDEITLYVMADAARRLANAEITTQELVDQSVVLFHGNRIKVDLTK